MGVLELISNPVHPADSVEVQQEPKKKLEGEFDGTTSENVKRHIATQHLDKNGQTPARREVQDIQGYSSVTPETDRLQDTLEYFNSVQNRTESANQVFIPAGIGIVLGPHEDDALLFSIMGTAREGVYDVPVDLGEISAVLTSDVLVCGVVLLKVDGYTALVHAGGPESVAELTARGLARIQEAGGDITQPIDVAVFANATDGYPNNVGPNGLYVTHIAELLGSNALAYQLSYYPVNTNSPIRAFLER